MIMPNILLGLLSGIVLGALIGRTQRPQAGARPLLANPFRGAIWGGLIGSLLALSVPADPPTPTGEVTSQDGQSAPPAVLAENAGEKPSAAVAPVADANQFKQDVLSRPGRTVVDFYATWCGPCKRLSPIVEKIAGEKPAGLAFVKVDVDKAPELAREYNIEALPTLVIFEQGKENKRIVGLQSEDDLRKEFGLK